MKASWNNLSGSEEEEYEEDENGYETEGGERRRWEELHDLNKVKQETRNLMKKHFIAKEDKELFECTFQPNILQTSLKMTEKNWKKDISDRVVDFNKKKEEKIKVLAENSNHKELMHCTFRPQLYSNTYSSKNNADLYSTKGIDKFIERQQKARSEKHRVKQILSGTKKTKLGKTQTTEEKLGYAQKYIRSAQPGFDNVFKDLKGKSFGECSLVMHQLLNSFEIQP